MSKNRRKWVCWLKQREQEQIHPCSAFLLSMGPRQIGWCPPPLGTTICLTQFTNSNDDFFQKDPRRHTQKSCSISHLGISLPSQFDT